MNIGARTLATIMLVAMLTLSAVNIPTEASATHRRQRDDKQLWRLYQKHDRKMELRASVLGISPDELREKLKVQNFDQIIKQSGFKDRESFHIALIGKMKQELKARGWDESKIKQFVEKKLNKYYKKAE